MSDGIESLGAMTTAGMAAMAIEGDSGGHGAHGACANCGATLVGPFCHACGQVGHLHRSMLHIVEEFFHGILHFDSKAWRTLPSLMFRPGRLTYNYIHGHRARYVTPMAMFLFSVFMMFMVFSLLGGAGKVPVTFNPASPAEEQARALSRMQEDVDDAHAELATAESDLAEAASAGDATETLVKQRDQARQQVDRTQQVVDKFKQALATGVNKTQQAGDQVKKALEADDANKAQAANNDKKGTTTLAEAISNGLGDINVTSDSPDTDGLEAKIKHKLKDPEFLLYKLQNTAYKFSWLLIPLTLPFLWLMFFWKRDVVMYDHAIFSLYSLSFMSLLFIIVSLLMKFTEGGLVWPLVVFAPPVHMFFHLKGTYSLSNGGALWRTLALLCITATTSVLFVVFIVTIGFVG